MATPVAQRDLATAAAPAPSVGASAPHIVATINGPGEIAAWLYPFAHALRQRLPGATLTAALLPCAFASGREAAVVAAMPGVDRVLDPDESLRLILRGSAEVLTPRPDVVLHFGGELLLSVALARRLGVPIVAYEEERVRWASLLDRVCVRDARAARSGREARTTIVGNLMVDAALLRVPGRATTARRGETLVLFPGSRPYFVRQLLPLFLRVAGTLRERRPGVRVALAKSDFITHRELAECLTGRAGRVVEGDDGRLHRSGERWVIESERGVSVDVLSPNEAMARADLAVTIPGTNTAELASLGIPMLLVLPTYRLHALPLPGLAGHLGGVPIVGPLIKEGVARAYVRARRFWAHPNRLAGEMIVPEMIGRLTSDQIATRLDELFDLPPQWTEDRLRQVMGAPGASSRLLDEVIDLLQTAG